MLANLKRLVVTVPMLMAGFWVTGAADAQNAASGLAILEQNCLRCHAVGPGGRSPHSSAPLFSQIVQRYDPELLAEAFAEGIVTGHPDMPEFVYTVDEIEDIIAFLKTLQ